LFFAKLVFCWFFENKLGNGLSHVWNRREKVGKGWKRCKKVGIDGALLENAGFHVMLQARVLFNRKFPYLGGSLFLMFGG